MFFDACKRIAELEAELAHAREECDAHSSALAKAKAHSTKLDASLRQCRERLKQVAKPAYEIRREVLLEAADELGRQIVDVYTCETQWAERLALDFAQRSVRRMAEEVVDG